MNFLTGVSQLVLKGRQELMDGGVLVVYLIGRNVHHGICREHVLLSQLKMNKSSSSLKLHCILLFIEITFKGLINWMKYIYFPKYFFHTRVSWFVAGMNSFAQRVNFPILSQNTFSGCCCCCRCCCSPTPPSLLSLLFHSSLLTCALT